MNYKIRNKKTNKRKTNKRKTNKRTNYKRRTYKVVRKNNTKRRKHIRKTKKQYGGMFNPEQMEAILQAINDHQDTEPFTDAEIVKYTERLNDISQFHANNFEPFYDNMTQHLEGLEDRTFKQWIDSVYEEHKDQVETDYEGNSEISSQANSSQSNSQSNSDAENSDVEN